MKKVISIILVLAGLVCCLCACSECSKNNSSILEVQSETRSDETSDLAEQTPPVDVKNLSAANIEKITGKQLEWLHNNADKFPENFVFSDLSGYGRVVSSASSAREALTSSTYITTKCELLLETDYYYGIYVRWEAKSNSTSSSNPYEEKVVCFKKSVCDYQNLKYSNDTRKGKIVTRDARVIKQILDYSYYAKFYKIHGYKVLYSKLDETSQNYKHTIYYIGTVFGDWGVKDTVTLYKQETVIPKSTGIYESSEKQKLLAIEVKGAFTDGGILK